MHRILGFPVKLIYPLLAAISALAQSSTVEGPGGGFVFDGSSRSIRPFVGLLGASYLGPPVLTGVAFASVAPDQQRAVMLSETGMHWVADLRNPGIPTQSLPGAMASPSQALWTADASAAVLFSAAEKQLQFLRQDGASVLLGPPCGLASLPSPVKLLAAAPAARIAAVAAPLEEGKNAVYLVQEGNPPQLVATFAGPVAAALAPGGDVLYVAGGASLWRIRNLSAAPETESLAEGAAELQNPAALAVAGNGQALFLAGAASRRIRIYDLSAQRFLEDVEVDSPPNGLEPFTATSFLLNPQRAPQDPVWILETTPAPRVIFIPSGE